jgi:hypothetical protein
MSWVTPAANAAHGRAMGLAGPDAPPEVVARLHVSLASMQWTTMRTARLLYQGIRWQDVC